MRTFLVGVAVVSSLGVWGCKGSAGKDGGDGEPGPPGGYAQAPRISSVEPATVSPGLIAQVNGIDFSIVAAENQVYVGGVLAEVLEATITTLRVRALVAPTHSVVDSADLIVVTNDQLSNPFTVTRVPRGTAIRTPIAASSDLSGFAVRDDGSLALISADRMLEVSVDGDLEFLARSIAANGHSSVYRADGVYYLAGTELRRFGDAVDRLVLELPIGQPRGLAFDATGNAYVLVQDGGTARVMKRDYVTFAVSELVSFPSSDVGALFEQEGILYVADRGAARIAQIPIAAPAVTTLAPIDVSSIAGDGTDELYVYQAERVRRVNTTTGTVTQWSAMTLGAGVAADGIGRGGNGSVYLRAGDAIWRLPDTTTLQSFVAPLASRVVGNIGGTLYAGSDATCGVGDSLGGVLYELRLSGRLQRVAFDFCGSGSLTYSNFDGTLLHPHPGQEAVISLDLAFGISESFVDLTGSIPSFVVSDPLDGSAYIANVDPLSGDARISKYGGDGTLVDADFVPASADVPTAGAAAGGTLVVYYGATRELRSTPTATGGVPVAFGEPGFSPADARLSNTFDGRFIVTDAEGSLWSLDAAGDATRLADVENASPFFEAGGGRLYTVGSNSIETVMP